MAEGGGLLNRYTVKSRIGGSNPPLSAKMRQVGNKDLVFHDFRFSLLNPKFGVYLRSTLTFSNGDDDFAEMLAALEVFVGG